MYTSSFFIYGVRIEFTTDNNAFFSFVQGTLNNYQISDDTSKADFNLKVAIDFNNRIRIEKSQFKIGNGVFLDDDKKSIVFDHFLFQGEFIKKDDDKSGLNINGNINKSVTEKVKHIIKANIVKDYSYQDMLFHHLYRELILLPVFWILRNKLGKYLMHASAVTDGDETFVFLGNDGVGKTTIALNLLEKESVSFFGDNFLLYDAEKIYPFIDTLRVNNSDHETITSYNNDPIFSTVFKGASRTHFNFDSTRVAKSKDPTRFYVLKQSGENKIVPITEEQFINYAFAINDYVKEFDKYSFANNLYFLFDDVSNTAKKEIESLTQLISNKKCALLSLKKTNDLKDLIKLFDQ